MQTDLINQDVLLWALGYQGPKFHAMIGDPPSGIGFLDQKWDTDHKGRDSWIAIMQNKFEAMVDHLLPGAHCIIWALPRTSHWTATALENSGLEIRDIIHHVFSEGVPKSNNIEAKVNRVNGNGDTWAKHGTALKPAVEHWIVARKKPIGTIYANCQEFGTGALDLETTRIGNGKGLARNNGQNTAMFEHYGSGPNNAAKREANGLEALGRWPSNLILTHSGNCTDQCAEDCAIRLMNQQQKLGNQFFYKGDWSHEQSEKLAGIDPFFYSGKPSKVEKEAGITTAPRKYNAKGIQIKKDAPEKGRKHNEPLMKNFHPTVKPIKLTKYLASLLLPPVEYGPRFILNPFAGSGSEMIGAILAGWDHIVGIERDPQYINLAEQRIAYWKGKINV